MSEVLYVVVRSDGTLKKKNRHLQLLTERGAINHANERGDKVIGVTVHLDATPVFIREEVLK